MLSEFGRVGNDATLRYTAQGTAVCGVSVAYNYGRKDQNGDRPTQWIEVVLWGKQADALAQYLTKGKQIYFSARDIRVEEFQKKDGTQGSKLTGDLVDIKFAYDGQQQSQAPSRQQQHRPAQQQNKQAAPASYDELDDNIPFANPYRGRRALLI